MPEILIRLFESTAYVIEIVGVSVLVMGFLFCLGRYLRHYSHMDNFDLVKEFKRGLGRTILIGLEILVAATIIKTITGKTNVSFRRPVRRNDRCSNHTWLDDDA